MKDINSHFTEDTQFSVPKNKEEEEAAVVTLNFFSIPISYSLKVNEKGINQKYKLLKPQKFLLFFITEPHKLLNSHHKRFKHFMLKAASSHIPAE